MYGIKEITKFEERKERHRYIGKEDLLTDISWRIRDDLSTVDDKEVNLLEQLFDGPILLRLRSRYRDLSYLVPVFGGTANDVLATIQKISFMCEEGSDSLGEYFEGLTFEDGVWTGVFGS